MNEPCRYSYYGCAHSYPKTQQVKAAHIDYLAVWMVWESRHSLSGCSSSGVSSATGKVRQLGGSLPKAPLDQGPGHLRSGSAQLRGRPGAKGCSLSRELWGLRSCAHICAVPSFLGPSKPCTSPHLPPTTHSSQHLPAPTWTPLPKAAGTWPRA